MNITTPLRPAATLTGSPTAATGLTPAAATPSVGGNAPASPTPQAPRKQPVPNILIVGESGSGKTRSLKNLPWESGRVAFIDTERKGFEWINRIPEDCYFDGSNPQQLLATMNACENNPKFDTIVVDSFTGYSLSAHETMKQMHSGFDIYTKYNSLIVGFLKRITSMRKRWIVTAIPEVLLAESAGNTVGVAIKRAAVHGREMEGKVESFFAYAVFLRVIAQPNARAKHVFVLSSDGASQAKIPEGVTDALTMDNDVNELLKLAVAAESKY